MKMNKIFWVIYCWHTKTKKKQKKNDLNCKIYGNFQLIEIINGY